MAQGLLSGQQEQGNTASIRRQAQRPCWGWGPGQLPGGHSSLTSSAPSALEVTRPLLSSCYFSSGGWGSETRSGRGSSTFRQRSILNECFQGTARASGHCNAFSDVEGKKKQEQCSYGFTFETLANRRLRIQLGRKHWYAEPHVALLGPSILKVGLDKPGGQPRGGQEIPAGDETEQRQAD